MNKFFLEDLKTEILKSNPSILLEQISIAGSLPQNKGKIPIFETLFKLIVSLPKNKFQNKNCNESNLQSIFEKLSKIEDWSFVKNSKTESVLDYPPIWILGTRYRIFPGLDNCAYVLWKNLVRYYYHIRDEFSKKFGYDPMSLIQQLLELQTMLVNVIEKNQLECKKINKMYLPLPTLTQEWSKTIQKWKESVNLSVYQKHQLEFGELDIPNPVDLDLAKSIYSFFSVGEKEITIFPHTFCGFLSTKLGNEYVKIGSSIHENANKNSIYHLFKKLYPFFPNKEIVLECSFQDTQKYDLMVLFDYNKLFLIKILNLDFIEDIQTTCKSLFAELKKTDEKIKAGNLTFYHRGKKAGILPHKDVETIPIILFETAKMNISMRLPRDEHFDSKYAWLGLFGDFLSLLDEIDDFMRFLKYIRCEKMLREKTRITAFSNLDLLAYYLQNHDSFLVNDGLVTMFESGLWDKFKLEQIKKYPDFQFRHDTSEEDDFWEYKAVDDSVFHVRNQMHGHAATVFFLPSKKDMWILGMSGNVQYNEYEVHCISLLAELIPYRFINNSVFDQLLERLLIPRDMVIRFSLLSTKTIEEQNIEPLRPMLSLISQKTPLHVKHSISPQGALLFYVIYEPDHFITFFNKKPLDAEKYVIKKILTEMCNYARIENSTSVITSSMNDLFKDAQAAFSFTTVQLGMPIPTSKTNYPDTLESDRSKTLQKVTEFLTRLNISPGVYEQDKAKKILNKVYELLNLEFVTRISNIEQTPLLYFLLHTEGQIIKDLMLHRERSRHDSQFKIRHSVEHSSKKLQQLMKLDISYRYSIEIAMKHWSEGTKQFTLEEWLELQALAELIVHYSYLSSYLNFGLGEYQLQIYDNYEFKIKEKNVTSLERLSTRVDKYFASPMKSSSNYRTTKEANKFLDDMDEPFYDEFKITCRNFFNVIAVCKQYLIEHKTDTQVITATILFEFCKKHYPEISFKDVTIVLDTLSLTKENMNHIFYPSDVRNRQFRHACRPILKFPDNRYLIDFYSLENIIDRLWAELDQGYLLYNNDFVNSAKLKKHLQKINKKASSDHEKAIYELFKAKTNLTKLNLSKNNRLLNNIDEQLPGEIDLLALFTHTKELFLVEAKNIKISFAARDMSNELKAFMKKCGYIEKFKSKIEFVQNHLYEILDAFNIKDSENWQIRSYFVTSNISFPQEPATDYKFITLHELKEIISMY